MRKTLLLLATVALAGCAPRQDPGIPIPKSASSGVAAMSIADAAIGQQADTVAAIDAARRVVAQNQSNAETTAYKAVCCRVQNGKPEVYLNMEQGPLENTNRSLDVAINGPGFFRVKTDPNTGDGFAYTRNGNFFINKNNELCLAHSERIEPPINFSPDATDITISQDGVVTVMNSGAVQKQVVGQIMLYQISDAEHLFPQGTLYSRNERNGEPIESKPKQDGAGFLAQTFLEGSNVDLNREKLRADFLDHWRAQLVK